MMSIYRDYCRYVLIKEASPVAKQNYRLHMLITNCTFKLSLKPKEILDIEIKRNKV
jgi:hypothetical protein